MLISHVLVWTGHLRANMRFSLFSLAFLPACFYAGLAWGVPGVAWSWLIAFPLTVALKMVLVNRLLDLTLAGYLSALRPALMACLAASAVVLLVRSGLPMSWSPEARLALEVSPGAFIYVAVLLGIFRVRVTTIYETIRVGVRSPHEDAGAITT